MGIFNFGKKKEEKKEIKKDKDNTGMFGGSVLLSGNEFDMDRYKEDLLKNWDIAIEEDTDDVNGEKDTILTEIGGNRVVITRFPAPVPNGEAELNAENNYMWPEAVEVTKTHQAHIFVCILGNEGNLVDKGTLFVKLMDTACCQENVIGVFTSGVVFEPNFYRDVASGIKEGVFPILDLIWFGLYGGPKGISAYTYGMDVFGKANMEILDTDYEPGDLLECISNMATYVILDDATLKDGETIGFSADDKRKITYSRGVSLPEEMTLKIESK